MNEHPCLRLGVLVSGNGTNLQSLLDKTRSAEIPAKVAVVLSNRKGAHALVRAREAGIPAISVTPNPDGLPGRSPGDPFLHPRPNSFPVPVGRDREYQDELMARILRSFQVDLVVLAGYMRILSGKFLSFFPRRVINVHPALLPEDVSEEKVILPDGTVSPVFRGTKAVKDALDTGVTFTGCTVHYVTAEVDKGEVIARAIVPVLPGDTPESLHQRIQAQEHRILPEAIRLLAGRLRSDGDR